MRNHLWRMAALLCLTLLITLQCPLAPGSGAAIGTDAGVFATVAKGMTQGLLPYRDLFDHKGPLLYVVDYAFYAVLGLGGLWLLECLTAFLTLLLGFRLVRAFAPEPVAWLSTFASAAAFGYQYGGGGFCENMALPLLLCAAILFLRGLRTQTLAPRDGLGLGLCFAGCLALRPNVAGLFVGYGAAIAAAWLCRGRARELWRYAGSALLGTLLGLLPLALWMSAAGILEDCARCYLAFNLQYASASPMPLWEWALQTLRQNRLWLVALLAAGFAGARAFKPDGALHAATFMAFVASFLFAGVSGRLYEHYLLVMLPFYFLLFGQALHWLYRYLRPPSPRERMAALLALTLLVQLDGFQFCLSRVGVMASGTSKAQVQAFTDELTARAPASSTLAVYGNNCAPYLYGRLRVGTRYPFSAPIIDVSAALRDDYLARMGQADFFVLPAGCAPADLPADVRERLDLLYDYDFDLNGYTAYRRKRQSP